MKVTGELWREGEQHLSFFLRELSDWRVDHESRDGDRDQLEAFSSNAARIYEDLD